jgi:mannose-6-phosphate isomerase-like protein (cupin superfamily)
MEARVVRSNPEDEFATAERVSIVETWNDASDSDVSIALARVEPGVTTQLHTVDVSERYVIVSGSGVVSIGDLPPTPVGVGDAVVIPAGTPQQIANTGEKDLIFYCVCSPRFQASGYRSLE